jgi:hypothetical protein
MTPTTVVLVITTDEVVQSLSRCTTGMHAGREIILLLTFKIGGVSMESVRCITACPVRSRLVYTPCATNNSSHAGNVNHAPHREGGMRLSNLAFVSDDACEQTCCPYGLQPQPMFIYRLRYYDASHTWSEMKLEGSVR